MVLLLDYMPVHRLSGIEGKDGNPLNEVRVLCNSILLNKGNLQVDKLPGVSLTSPGALEATKAKGSVLVIHENRGLNDHIRSVAGRSQTRARHQPLWERLRSSASTRT